MKMDRYLTVKEVASAMGVSVKTVYEEVKAGRLVRQRRISKGRVGWLESEFIRWLEERPRGNEELVAIEDCGTAVVPAAFTTEIILFLCLCSRA